MKQKGLNDLIKQGEKPSKEDQKRLEEIDKLINANKHIEVTTSTKLPVLIIVLVIVVIILVVLVNVLDNKVDNRNKNNINISEIR